MAAADQQVEALKTSAPSFKTTKFVANRAANEVDRLRKGLKTWFDFYNGYDPLAASSQDQARYQQYLSTLSPEQQQRIGSGLNVYQLDLRNVGGLVMPVVLQKTYDDGTQDIETIPAELWRKNNEQVSKLIFTPKALPMRGTVSQRPLSSSITSRRVPDNANETDIEARGEQHRRARRAALPPLARAVQAALAAGTHVHGRDP